MAGYGFNTGMDGHRVRPLTEADKEEIAEGLKIIYGNARERMLKNVSGRLSKGITQYGWAERKANEVLAAHAQLERDLNHAHDQREKLLSNVMDRAYVTGSQKFYSDMRSVLGETAHISPNSMKAGYILADLNNSLNASERRILRQFDDKYADIIGAVSSEMATGTMTTRQAVGEALIAFADEGIDGFVDRGGHHWTLENYSEMAVLTAIERSTISGYVDTMQEYGYDLAIIDGHAGSCPICAAWEGVIVSISGDDPDYPSLDDAENDGCFHPRCMHGITTYYPEISHTPAGGFRTEPREIEPEEPAYTARSKQRYMERMIRKYKDRAIVAQTPQQLMQARNKVRQWEDALDDLIESQPEDNYLYHHRSREAATVKAAQTGAKLEDGSTTKPTQNWQENHAIRFYKEVASRAEYVDARRIAEHTSEFTVQQLEDIRKHMFVNVQKFTYDEPHKFYCSYEQSQAWQRLTEGKGTPSDILMLRHENEELTIIREKGYYQDEAHVLANQKYDWWSQKVAEGVEDDYVSEFPLDHYE